MKSRYTRVYFFAVIFAVKLTLSFREMYEFGPMYMQIFFHPLNIRIWNEFRAERIFNSSEYLILCKWSEEDEIVRNV